LKNESNRNRSEVELEIFKPISSSGCRLVWFSSRSVDHFGLATYLKVIWKLFFTPISSLHGEMLKWRRTWGVKHSRGILGSVKIRWIGQR
jgi:hypothetical protein